ncbi:hypothetical protein ACG95P_11160 [Acinetobacter guillouiae]|uniref:hypothetical protein n=1 Tax=Acinetobacter guillouiae TaxID=106649 RepID=UPI003340A374
MSPRWVGVQDVPLTQQKIFVIFSSLKSEASPTQSNLNFKVKRGIANFIFYFILNHMIH